jgi:thiosulfate/3-mercaptopyruvate sulfurtransferase
VPRPLASTDWLQRHLDDSVLRLADVRWYLDEPERGRQVYLESHIPGAFYVDLEADLSAEDGSGRHPLPDWDEFAERMGDLGISDDSVVVAYDDRGGGVAARLWWMLRAIGHDRSHVLDGGLTAWIAAGGPVTDAVPDHLPARLTVRLRPGLTVDRDEVRTRLGSTVTLDARGGQRYRGETEPIDPVAGHIPGALSAPYEENLGPRQRFLPPEALAARYRALGVGEDTDVVVYCGSGVTACHDILAMEHAGVGRPILYPGSWSDWSSAGYPVAKGPDPGPAPV